jgi:hypothetical protein
VTLKKIGEIASPQQISQHDLLARVIRKVDGLGGVLRSLTSDLDDAKRALADVERALMSMMIADKEGE